MKKRRKTGLCYLRTHRRLWQLTLVDLAELVGVKSTSHLSRIEHGERTPKLEVALACQVIFGVPPSAMFPHVYSRVEDTVMWNTYKLHSALENTTSPAGIRKRELCDAILARAVTRPGKPDDV